MVYSVGWTLFIIRRYFIFSSSSFCTYCDFHCIVQYCLASYPYSLLSSFIIALLSHVLASLFAVFGIYHCLIIARSRFFVCCYRHLSLPYHRVLSLSCLLLSSFIIALSSRVLVSLFDVIVIYHCLTIACSRFFVCCYRHLSLPYHRVLLFSCLLLSSFIIALSSRVLVSLFAVIVIYHCLIITCSRFLICCYRYLTMPYHRTFLLPCCYYRLLSLSYHRVSCIHSLTLLTDSQWDH